MGLPCHVQNHLENRMLHVTLTLSVLMTFPINLFIDTAEHIYDLSCFDQEMEEASSDDNSDNTDTADDSDSEKEEDV